jgi:hypothetical protein
VLAALCSGFFSCKREKLEDTEVLDFDQTALSFIKWKIIICFSYYRSVGDNWTCMELNILEKN